MQLLLSNTHKDFERVHEGRYELQLTDDVKILVIRYEAITMRSNLVHRWNAQVYHTAEGLISDISGFTSKKEACWNAFDAAEGYVY